MNIMIPTALVAVLAAAPALALDYNCSPMTGGCTPRASQPSAFDSPYPSTYVPRIDRRDAAPRRGSHRSKKW